VKQIRISLLLMILTMLLVALGQGYWLLRLYDNEFDNLKKGMDVQFRNSFYQLQRTRFLNDSVLFSEITDTIYTEKEQQKPLRIPLKKQNKNLVLEINGKFIPDSNDIKQINKINPENIASIRMVKQADQFTLPPELIEMMIIRSEELNEDGDMKKDSSEDMNNLRLKAIGINDSTSGKNSVFIDLPVGKKTTPEKVKSGTSRRIPIIRMISNNKTLNDSIPISDIKKFFDATLQQQLTYKVIRQQWKRGEDPKKDKAKDTLNGFITSEQISGIKNPFSYQILFPETRKYIIKQMMGQIAGSILMILVLMTAFSFIYHTINRQRRLADMKNEFISNITHELKTPIATVHVALEALQNFNAIDDPKKSKEYLDISVSELTRLELLVDKVLKRSMLEKDAIKMDATTIDLHQLVEKVILTMKVQFEKWNATLNITTVGENFSILADRLHMTSVIYNLLENAIKYSDGKPEIDIWLTEMDNSIRLDISDKGIGIPKAYQDKIFEPFFRVPHQDRHDAKGHGLGLSYVAQIIKLHHGTITISNAAVKGTVFTIELPTA
jgi:signal transduction histidine kinase